MFILFDLVFLFFMLFYLPFAFCKGKLNRAMFSRFGFLPKQAEFQNPIWIHAVSVGEVVAARPLVEELRQAFRDKQIVLSTVTSTGNKVAQAIVNNPDNLFYLPFDFSFAVKKTIKRLKPALVILMETEIWPNLISYLRQNNVPVILMNARISDKSYRGYTSIKFFIAPVLRKINLFCAQTQRDAQRLISLGVSPEKIVVTGNMKFDLKIPFATLEKKDLGLGQTDQLIVAGSTHPGEEKIMLHIFKDLRSEFKNLALLLAPRHPERAKEVACLARGLGLKTLFFSQIKEQKGDIHDRIFILDKIGELAGLYRLADLVFVGASLVNKGGHNIIEPAQFAKPIIVGAHTQNFREIVDYFLQHQALLQVPGAKELKETIKNLLSDTRQREALSQKANQILRLNQGATQRNVELLRKF